MDIGFRPAVVALASSAGGGAGTEFCCCPDAPRSAHVSAAAMASTTRQRKPQPSTLSTTTNPNPNPSPNPIPNPNPSSDPSPSTSLSLSSSANPKSSVSLFPAFFPTRRSLFPAPLSFLWFKNRKKKELVTEVGPDLLLAEIKLDAVISQSASDPIPRQSAVSVPNPWISRFLAISSLWQNRRGKMKATLEAPRKEECPPHFPLIGCSGCNHEACESCPIKNVHSFANHNRDSFSKFLRQVSLFDIKVISEMSYLCNLAYTISDIKPGELLKLHRLRLVTSSLEKKAEAKEKFKDLSAALTKQKQGQNEEGEVDVIHTTMSGDEVNEGIEIKTRNGIPCGNDSLDSLSKPLPIPEVIRNSLDPQEKRSPLAALDVVEVAEEETRQEVAKALQSLHSSPCEWFICDDPDSHTRIFVIQGSESLASWQVNLSFDPTKFEDVGVLVHRGIYEAAKGIYEQVLPDVLAHLRAHGEYAQIRFTGHSLGGSLAVLVVLMLLLRGVVSSNIFLPVVTLGAPYIMCGGDFLMHKLKLAPNFIQSVMIHKDIVPRAFACHYPDHVAEVLRRLNGKFRDHPCLKNQKLLYAPMGQMLILQPEESESRSHPLLPEGCAIYAVGHMNDRQDNMKVMELYAAQRAFLNSPHPLDILRDPGAYGAGGRILREHHPCSYSKAANTVLGLESKRKRGMVRAQRRKRWWPFIAAKSSLLVQKGAKSSGYMEGRRSGGLGKPSTALTRHALTCATTDSRFPVRGLSMQRPRNETIRKYARLIASQHIQMGMLFIVSVRLLIAEGFASVFFWS